MASAKTVLVVVVAVTIALGIVLLNVSTPPQLPGVGVRWAPTTNATETDKTSHKPIPNTNINASQSGREGEVVMTTASTRSPHRLPAPSTALVASIATASAKRAPWEERLYTPTYITHMLGEWLIVDCWHHRVLSSPTLEAPVGTWAALTTGTREDIIVPHSVATDGRWLVTESSVGGSDGDNHTILAFEKRQNGDGFEFSHKRVACEGNAARRPHRIIYDGATKAYYLYLTNPAHVAKFVATATGLVQEYCRPVPELRGTYARSILALNGSLYITAGPRAITQLDIHTLKYQTSYSVRGLRIAVGKMNDLAYIDGWWYATSTVRCALVRFRTLRRMGGMQDLTKGLDLCHDFNRKVPRCTGGTPYYVTKIGKRIYVPYIFHCSGVVSFISTDEGPTDVRHHWGSGWVEQAEDIKVRGDKW